LQYKFTAKNRILNLRNLILFFAIVFIACQEKKEEIPQDLLEKEKFKKILIDFHLANAAEQSNKILKDSTVFKFAESYHPFIYKINDISKEQITKTLDYYFKHPKMLDKIYEEIIEDLTKLEAEQKEKKEKLDE